MSETSQKPPVPFKKILSDDYDDGQIVMTISGTITKLFEKKTGTSSGGEWEFQSGTLKDSEGTEIGVSFSKCTQPMTAKGKKITVKSVKTEQHGWNGVKVEDQTFTPKGKDEAVTKRILKITASAEIVYEGGGESGKQSQGNTGQSGGTKGAGGTSSQLDHPDLIISDMMALHRRCYDYAARAYGGGEALTDHDYDMIQAATASLYIQGCRDNLHMNFAERASKPIPPKITPPPDDPTLWKTCMIPKGNFMGKTLADLPDEVMLAFYEAMKDKETPLANCVKQAAKDRNVIPKPPEPEKEEEDDVPM